MYGFMDCVLIGVQRLTTLGQSDSIVPLVYLKLRLHTVYRSSSALAPRSETAEDPIFVLRAIQSGDVATLQVRDGSWAKVKP